jgi:hypothetical protein
MSENQPNPFTGLDNQYIEPESNPFKDFDYSLDNPLDDLLGHIGILDDNLGKYK